MTKPTTAAFRTFNFQEMFTPSMCEQIAAVNRVASAQHLHIDVKRVWSNTDDPLTDAIVVLVLGPLYRMAQRA